MKTRSIIFLTAAFRCSIGTDHRIPGIFFIIQTISDSDALILTDGFQFPHASSDFNNTCINQQLPSVRKLDRTA